MGLFSSKIATKRMVPLCRQLATSYDAGIPLIRSLDIISEQQRDKKLRDLLARIRDDIKRGDTLGEAARKQSKYLPTFFVELLASGELGGKLDVMLRDLADYFEDRLERQRKIRRMMTLPIIQLLAAWFLGSFSLMLVGRLSGLISGKEGTSGVQFLSRFVDDWLRFQAMAMCVAAGVFVVMVVLARLNLFGWVYGLFTTHIWPVSIVTRKFGLARFFRSLSLLLGSGMHVPRAIESSAAVTANPYIERDLLKAVPIVEQGRTLVEAFASSRYLTPTAREMLLIGEHSGNLEGSLKKVADYHFEEANHAVNVATKVVGVLIVLAVALTIGYIIVSFYQQLYGGMMNELGV